MDDGPDYFDVGWFKDSPSEIWGKNDLEGCGPLGAIVQIILLPLYILQFIVYSPFLLIYGIFVGIGKLFDSGSGEEVFKKNKQNAEQKKAQIGCPPNIIDESEVDEYLMLLQKEWQYEYEHDPLHKSPPKVFPKNLKPIKEYILKYGVDDAVKWLGIPSKSTLEYYRTYDFNGKHPTLEETNLKNDASDLLKKQETERKEFFEKLEANLRKEMSESAYWQNTPEEKRDRQISRYLKEAKLDLERLGLDKASKLWFGFIKRSDAKRAFRQNPRSV